VNEETVRQIVRDVIARRRASAAVAPPAREASPARRDPSGAPSWRLHVSHGQFSLGGGDAEGRCLVEPAVRCSHCGYCQSYGH
jgi:hypothetical protein